VNVIGLGPCHLYRAPGAGGKFLRRGVDSDRGTDRRLPDIEEEPVTEVLLADIGSMNTADVNRLANARNSEDETPTMCPQPRARSDTATRHSALHTSRCLDFAGVNVALPASAAISAGAPTIHKSLVAGTLSSDGDQCLVDRHRIRRGVFDLGNHSPVDVAGDDASVRGRYLGDRR
jgi:hypothetical protein